MAAEPEPDRHRLFQDEPQGPAGARARFRVDVFRGGLVESRHTVEAAVVAADATVPPSADAAGGCFGRSALKPLQALVLVEGGAADHFGLTAEELAVAAGSHAGEPVHAAAVASMLAKGGFTTADLDCGIHRPFSEEACDELARQGLAPGPLLNNCSGKHAGFLLAARHAGFEPVGYRHAAHPLQRLVAATVGEVCDLPLAGRQAVDGCGVPTFAIPVEHLARGFARFASGLGLTPQRAAAAARIRAAIAAHPAAYCGSGRLDTQVAELFGTDLLLKSGAEGVICAALPAAGVGIAVKAADGAARAAQAVMARLLHARLREPPAAALALLASLASPTLRNHHGEPVGRITMTEFGSGIQPFLTLT